MTVADALTSAAQYAFFCCRKFTASLPFLPQSLFFFCCKFTTGSPFYHKFATNMLLFVVNLPQVCSFLPQVYLKFPFFQHKSTANMSIFVAKFVLLCLKFTACFLFSAASLPHCFSFHRKSVANMPYSTAKSAPFYYKFTASSPFFIASLPQVCHFLPQVYLKFLFFHHKSTANMCISVAKFVPFVETLPQVFFSTARLPQFFLP